MLAQKVFETKLQHVKGALQAYSLHGILINLSN